jgi:hypothetical protein
MDERILALFQEFSEHAIRGNWDDAMRSYKELEPQLTTEERQSIGFARSGVLGDEGVELALAAVLKSLEDRSAEFRE